MLKPWILTHSGKAFDLSAPVASAVCLEDIAHNLSRIQRFCGSTSVNCSVAIHSVVASYIVRPEYAAQALMHDAAEAYIGDIPGPLKWMIGHSINKIEKRILNLIFDKYKIETCEISNKFVRVADFEMLRFEKENFMPEHPDPWDILMGIAYPNGADNWRPFYKIDDWRTHRRVFLDRAKDLGLL